MLVRLFILKFILISFFLSAQKNKLSTYKAMYQEADKLYKLDNPTSTTDSIALARFIQSTTKALENNNFNLAVDALIKIGNIHQTYQRFDSANEYYRKSIFFNQNFLKDDKLKYESFLYLGSSFYFTNIIDSAQIYFEEASIIAESYNKGILPEKERLYNSLGVIYFESANYLQAKNYFEKTITVNSRKENSEKDYFESHVGANNNIANCLLKLKQYDSALVIYKSLLKYQVEPEIKEKIIQNTAHIYYQIGEYDNAINMYNKLGGLTTNNNKIKALNDIGRIYISQNKLQQAEAIFDSAIAFNKQISINIKNKDEALAYLYRSNLAFKQGLLDEAITWCNDALKEVHLNYKSSSVIDLPEDVSQTVSPITLFEILLAKAKLLNQKFFVTNKNSFLIAALQTYTKAIETAEFIKMNFDNDESKFFFNQNYKEIYNNAINLAYECIQLDKEKYINDYIYILENYKGNILFQNLINTEITSNINLPDSIKIKDKNLKQLIAFYTARINNNTKETDNKQLQAKLVDLQVQLSRLHQLYFANEKTTFYKGNNYKRIKTLKQLEQFFSKNTAFLAYYKSDSILYALAIGKKNIDVKKITLDSIYTKHYNSFISKVYNHNEGERYDGYSDAYSIYNYIIKPVNHILEGSTNWVVFPGDELYYLPVEALSSNPDSRKYLMQEKTISYHYSFSLLAQHNDTNKENTIKKTVIAFAPFSKSDQATQQNKIEELPNSKLEIETLGNNLFLNENATKEIFIRNAPQFNIIHLATHAEANDSASNWIQFYPNVKDSISNKLFLQEIYNLGLSKTELVVLSACETGAGKSTAGEGLISLSRSFIYAGADGVVSTLWKTEDKITAYIMRQFHANINNQIPVEKALQLAKLSLLKDENISAKYKTPNYWANFVYVGKIKSNHKSIYTSKWAWVAVVVCCLLLFFGYIKTKK